MPEVRESLWTSAVDLGWPKPAMYETTDVGSTITVGQD